MKLADVPKWFWPLGTYFVHPTLGVWQLRGFTSTAKHANVGSGKPGFERDGFALNCQRDRVELRQRGGHESLVMSLGEFLDSGWKPVEDEES